MLVPLKKRLVLSPLIVILLLVVDYLLFNFPLNQDFKSQIIGYSVVAALVSFLIKFDKKNKATLLGPSSTFGGTLTDENGVEHAEKPNLGFFWIFYMFISTWSLCIAFFGGTELTVWHVLPVLIIGFCVTIYLNIFADEYKLTVLNKFLRRAYILSALVTVFGVAYVLYHGVFISPF